MANIWRKTGILLAFLALLTGAVAQTARRNGEMERRRQELKLELLRERARILREDPEAAAIRGRIEQLQLELSRVVNAKPSVQRLRADLAAVEKILQPEPERR